MSTTQRITSYLDENGIAYRLIEHEAAGTAEEYHRVLGTRYEQQAKALFLRVKRGKAKSFAIMALQAQKRADLPGTARLLNATEVRLATAEQLREVTGCAFGELPPFGKPFETPLLFDSELAKETEIYFNIGELTRSIVLAPSEIVTLEEPLMF